MGLLTRFARQWVAGETRADAIRAAKDANARGIHALVNHLGEHYREKGPVEATIREYLELLAAMRVEGIRGDVSVKPTQFGVLIDREYARAQMVPVLDAAKLENRILWIDMEGASTTDDTIWIAESLLDRSERIGICLQANLKRTDADLLRLVDRGALIRLVKGAYSETPDIAFVRRSDIDRRFVEFMAILFERGRDFAVASHDGRIVDRALELARDHPVSFEFQMLQGVRDPLKNRLVASGQRVAEYIPYGPDWLPYFSRRLRERPRNVITMVRSFVSG